MSPEFNFILKIEAENYYEAAKTAELLKRVNGVDVVSAKVVTAYVPTETVIEQLPPSTPLGERIKTIRLERFPNMSRRAFAKSKGLDAATICSIEGGKRNPGLKALRNLAQALDLTPEEEAAFVLQSRLPWEY